MRKLTLCLVATLCASVTACANDEGTMPAEPTTTGGEGKPVGPSRVAAPLDEAGPLAFTPGEAGRTIVRQEPFDIGADREDPLMEDRPSIEVESEHRPPVVVNQDEVEQRTPPGTEACPADLPGLRVDVTDVYDGAAVLVTGDSSQAAALQQQARRMVGLDEGPSAAVAKPGDQPLARGTIGDGVPVQIEVVDLARGARISYFAQDPGDVTRVRNEVRGIAAQMERGNCPSPASSPSTR